MGWIRKATHRSGKQSWQAGWRDPSGAVRSKNFSRKVDAERYLITVENDKLSGQYIDPRLGRITFADWSQQVEAGRFDVRPSTQARDESCLRSLVLPTFGDLQIGSIQPTTIRQWVADLHSRGYAANTVRQAYWIISRTFHTAVQTDMLQHSPCRGIVLPRQVQAEKRFLSPDEIRQLSETIAPRFSALVLTAAYTGARIGELAALDVDHFAPLHRSVRIERTLTEVQGTAHIAEPKTRAANRTITIPAWLVDTLTEHLTKCPPDGSGFLFTAPAGGPLRRSTFGPRFWKPAVRDSVGEPMRFHDLRHSHVALLIDQGTHPSVIASRLGHISVKTVLDVYGHLYDGLDRDAADALASPLTESSRRRRC